MSNRKQTKPAGEEKKTLPVVIKAKVPVEAFRSALKVAEEAMKADRGGIRQATTPILGCVVIHEEKGSIVVEYCGTDTFAQAPVGGSGKGSVAIPLSPLRAFVGAITADEVEIIKAADEMRVRLISPGRSLALIAMSPEDAPRFSGPAGEDSFASFSLAEGVLKSLLALTLPFVSREETRYYLNGVAFKVQDRVLTAVATDGHRLGKRETTIAGEVANFGLSIVPRPTCEILTRVVGKSEADVQIAARTVEVHAGGVIIRSKLIEGTFPNFERVIPQHGPHQIEVQAAEVDKILKAAMGMGRRPAFGRAIRILGQGSAAQLTVKGPDQDLTFESVVEAKVEGSPSVIGVNGAYLAVICKALGGGGIKLNLCDDSNGGAESARGPIRITSTNSADGDLCILMPMRV